MEGIFVTQLKLKYKKMFFVNENRLHTPFRGWIESRVAICSLRPLKFIRNVTEIYFDWKQWFVSNLTYVLSALDPLHLSANQSRNFSMSGSPLAKSK